MSCILTISEIITPISALVHYEGDTGYKADAVSKPHNYFIDKLSHLLYCIMQLL